MGIDIPGEEEKSKKLEKYFKFWGLSGRNPNLSGSGD